MKLNKITIGFVIQTFDTKLKRFISQEFFAGDQCDYEDREGNAVDPSLFHGKTAAEVYLPFDMVQPVDGLCQKCGSPLNLRGRCKDKTCPYSNHSQSWKLQES